jgi:hypothetical protein
LPTVPVKVSRPVSEASLSTLTTIEPPPRNPAKLPVPLTTSQTALWTELRCIGAKRILRRPRGQRNVVITAGLPPPAGLAAAAERRPADEGLAEDLGRVAFKLGDARLEQDRVAGHRGILLGLDRGDRSDLAAVVIAAGREANCSDRQRRREPFLPEARRTRW